MTTDVIGELDYLAAALRGLTEAAGGKTGHRLGRGTPRQKTPNLASGDSGPPDGAAAADIRAAIAVVGLVANALAGHRDMSLQQAGLLLTAMQLAADSDGSATFSDILDRTGAYKSVLSRTLDTACEGSAGFRAGLGYLVRAKHGRNICPQLTGEGRDAMAELAAGMAQVIEGGARPAFKYAHTRRDSSAAKPGK